MCWLGLALDDDSDGRGRLYRNVFAKKNKIIILVYKKIRVNNKRARTLGHTSSHGAPHAFIASLSLPLTPEPTDDMGCGASTPKSDLEEGNPEASAAKHLAPPPPVEEEEDPFGDVHNGGETGGMQEEALEGLTGVATPPPPRQTKPRTAPSAGGRGQAGVASEAISIDLDFGGIGGDGDGGRRPNKRSSIITSSGGGGGMSSAAAARGVGGSGAGGKNTALHGVELGALHKALTAACDKSTAGAVDMQQFIEVVQGLSSGANANNPPPEKTTIESLFRALDTDGEVVLVAYSRVTRNVVHFMHMIKL